jgi:hypothetical protein
MKPDFTWGGCPQTPGVYRMDDQSMKVKGRTQRCDLHTSATDPGARVAPQRCPILRERRGQNI